MVMGNVKPKNGMFALGVGRAQVQTLLIDALKSPAAEAAVKSLAAGGSGTFPVSVGGYACEMFIHAAGPKGIVSIFPVGASAIEMPKHLMKAAIWLWKSL